MAKTNNRPFPHLNAKEISALQAGQFELQCLSMKLESCSDENEVAFSGSGYISQTANHRFHFTLFTSETRYGENLENRIFAPYGQFLTDRAFYLLSARDTSGREWKSAKLLISTEDDYLNAGLVCSGNFDELVYTTEFDSDLHDFVSMYVFDDIDAPLNEVTVTETTTAGTVKGRKQFINASSFTGEGVKFSLAKEEGLFRINARGQEKPLPEHVEIYVQEALQFVLAHPMPWSVMMKRHNGRATTHLRFEKEHEIRPTPPIAIRPVSSTEPFWNMFYRYYSFVVASNNSKPHPISVRLRAVSRASATTMQVQSLVLTAAVESLLSKVFGSYGKMPKAKKEEIDKVSASLVDLDISEEMRLRIEGTLGTMKAPRAADQLKALCDKGAITHEQWKAWQTLRNASSHKFLAETKSPEELYALYASVLVLLYHLVFFAIDYDGSYTDWGESGWPTKQYSKAKT